MTQTGPWSVKGIDQRAREAAREAAKDEGVTLGEYLNRLLMSADEEEQNANQVSEPYRAQAPQPEAASSTLDRLTRRIEATEARSTLAITGMDQTVLGLVARLENSDNSTAAIAGHVEGVIDELRSTHEALQHKVGALENDDTNQKNLDALKSLEGALGKLASHVYAENEMVQNETQAIKGRVESGFTDVTDRVEAMETKVETTLSDAAARVENAVQQAELRAEGTARHLSERMSNIETKVHERLADTEDTKTRLTAVEGDVSGALDSMEGTLVRIQDRLNRAETTTDAALKALESTFENLDARVEKVAAAADPEEAEKLRAAFEQRFEDLTKSVRESVEQARTELADEIARAATGQEPEIVNALKDNMADVQRRLTAAEERQTRTMDSVGDQVSRMSASFDQRLRDVETTAGNVSTDVIRDEVERLGETVDERLAKIEDREASAVETALGSVNDRLNEIEARESTAIETVSAEMGKIADKLEERVQDSETKSAQAIESVGEQVSVVANRMQHRQDEAFKAFSEKLEDNRKRSDARLSDALSNVSERLELMQSQASTSLSPVQKAIASLATRLESLEDFTTPPFAQTATGADLPEMPELPQNQPLFDEPKAEANPQPAAATNASEAESIFAADFEGLLDTSDAPVTTETASAADFNDDRLTADIRAAADQIDADSFEAGIEGWEVTPSVNDTYSDDFEGVTPPKADASQEYVADLPSEPDTDEADPLAALGDWQEDASETRESDIFDQEFGETLADVPAATAGAPFDVKASAAKAEAEANERASAETGDYIARARRAALAASASTDGSTTKKKKPKRGGGKGPGGTSTGSGRLPLYAAASVVVLAGAGVVGYQYLRGKQDAPIAAPADVYADTAPINMDDIAAAEADAMTAGALTDETDVAMLEGAADPMDGAEDELFDDVTETAATDDSVEPVDVAATTPPAPAASFGAIPSAVTIDSAANSGNRIAQFELGESKLGAGDYAAGAELVGKSARQGLPVAQYRYAKLHEKGLGVPKDLALAREWTEKAAIGGNVKAMHDLAVFFAEGEGGQQSYAGSVEWFRKAAEFGVVDSQYNLGVLYEQGLGISPDTNEALFWYAVSAKSGDASAPAKVQELGSSMSIEMANKARDRAAKWQPARASSISNGRFGAQPWNTGNPMQTKGVQEALNALGYAVGKPDGAVGPATTKAVREYQRDNGLSVTGRIDTALVNSLNTKASPARGSR